MSNFIKIRHSTAILLFVLCAGLFSCQSTNDFAVDVTKGNGDLSQKDFFENPRYIFLDDTNPQAVLKYLDKVMLLKDRIVVSDNNRKRLVVFDGKGKFLASTDALLGKGKNEYLRFSDCSIDTEKQQIYMGCDNPYQMMIFDSNLHLLKVIKTKDYFPEFTLDEKYLYAFCKSHSNLSSYELRRYDKNNLAGKYRVLLTFDKGILGVRGMGHSLCGNDGHIFFSMPFSNEIHEIRNGEVVNTASLDFNGDWFSYDDSRGLRGKRFYKKNIDKSWNIQNIIASDSVLFFNTNQAPFYKIDRLKGTGESYKYFEDLFFPVGISWFTPICGDARQVVFEISAKAVRNYLKLCKEKHRAIMPDIKNLAVTDSTTNPVLQILQIR